MNNEQNIQDMVHLSEKSTNKVILTQAEVDASEERRQRKPKTIRQLPVFRAASNLTFYVAAIEIRCPRKMRCFVDQLECLTTKLLRVLVLANERLNERWDFCVDAYASVVTIAVKLETVYKLGIINKDDYNKIKRTADSVTAQIKGWQNSVNKESIQL